MSRDGSVQKQSGLYQTMTPFFLLQPLSRIDQTHMDSIITGDFNVDFKHVESTGSLAHIMNNIILSYNFKQVISQPTRVNERSSTIIDLTFTNIESKISYGVAVVSGAVHLMNFLVIHMKKEPIHRHKYVSSRNYRRVNIINAHASIRKFRAKSNPCHWHSEDIDRLKPSGIIITVRLYRL